MYLIRRLTGMLKLLRHVRKQHVKKVHTVYQLKDMAYQGRNEGGK